MRFRLILFIMTFLIAFSASAKNNFQLKTIVIDAGHGGKDPGAIGANKSYEKDVALAVALKFGEYVQKNFPDVKVVYTRKTDVFLELHQRAEIANKAKADLFVAIHCNSSTNDGLYGSSSYILGLHRSEANLEVAKRENAVILLEDDRDKNYDFNPNTPEGHIIMSMKQNAFLDQSIDFASKVENQMETYAKRKSLGVKQAGFYVLYKTAMPSLLAEIGFISNAEEEKFLNSVKGQDQIAAGLFNAFRDYKNEMEGSTQMIEDTFDEAQPVVKREPSSKVSASENVKPETSAKPTAVEKKDTEEPKKTEPAKEETTSAVETKPEPVKPEPVKTEPVKPATPKPEPIVPKPGSNRHPLVPDNKPGKGIVFKVQLFTLKGELKDYSRLLKLFNTLSCDELDSGLTRYYGGSTEFYAEARDLLKSAHANSYKDAYIVGFKDGVRMSADMLKAFESQ